MSLTFDFPGFHKQWDDQQGNSSSFDKTNKDETNRLQNLAADAWHDDLQELSGEAEDEQQEGTAAPAAADQQHVPHKQQRQHQHQHAEVSARVPTSPSLCNTHDGQQADAWGSPRKQQRTDLSSSPSGSSSAGASTAAGHVDHHQQQQQVPEAVLLLIVDLLDMRDMMAVACCCKAWHECLLQSNQDVWAQQEQHLLGVWSAVSVCGSISLPNSHCHAACSCPMLLFWATCGNGTWKEDMFLRCAVER